MLSSIIVYHYKAALARILLKSALKVKCKCLDYFVEICKDLIHLSVILEQTVTLLFVIQGFEGNRLNGGR